MNKKSLAVILLSAFLLVGVVQRTNASPDVYVFQVKYKGINYTVAVESNSTVTDFYFNGTGKELTFNVTGDDGTPGFCNATIPKNLLWANPITAWLVYVNETLVVAPVVTQNATHTFIYFAYSHSTQTVRVIGTNVTDLSVDITGDGLVDIFDGVELAIAFGMNSTNPQWDPMLDLYIDGFIDIFDIVVWANNFGTHI